MAAACRRWCSSMGSGCAMAMPAPWPGQEEMGQGSHWTKTWGFGDGCAGAWACWEHEAGAVLVSWP